MKIKIAITMYYLYRLLSYPPEIVVHTNKISLVKSPGFLIEGTQNISHLGISALGGSDFTYDFGLIFILNCFDVTHLG
jgi:hypothetical protein